MSGPSHDERREIEDFIHMEARLADESRYDEWEALLTDDVHYWVPYGKADYDPADRISFINDNRTRVATLKDFLKTLEAAGPHVLLLVQRGSSQLFVVIKR